MEKSRDRISFATFDSFPLNLRNSPAIKDRLAGGLNVHRWPNSHRQLIYRITHGLAEVAQFLSIQTPVKRSADIGTV